MLSRKTIILAVASAGVAASAATGAYALAAQDGNDAAVGPRPAVALSAAVTAAERQAGGYATRAEYEQTSNGWAFDVDVVNGAKVFDVRIDANSGKVISAKEDAADNGREDKEDGEGHEGHDKAD